MLGHTLSREDLKVREFVFFVVVVLLFLSCCFSSFFYEDLMCLIKGARTPEVQVAPLIPTLN